MAIFILTQLFILYETYIILLGKPEGIFIFNLVAGTCTRVPVQSQWVTSLCGLFKLSDYASFFESNCRRYDLSSLFYGLKSLNLSVKLSLELVPSEACNLNACLFVCVTSWYLVLIVLTIL